MTTFVASAGGTTTAGPFVSQAGDVFGAAVKYEGAGGFTSVSLSGGGNSFTFGTTANVDRRAFGGSEPVLHWGYILNASASASFSFTMTLGAGSFAYVLVMQFRPPSAGTTVFGAAAIAENTTTTLNSGSVSVSGTDLIALGAFAEYTAAGTSNEQLGGVAATGVLHPSWPSLWYRLPTSNFSGAATATLGAADNQLGGVMVLQVAAGGGGGSVDQGAGWNRDMLTGRLPHMRMKEPAGFKRRDRIYVPARLAA